MAVSIDIPTALRAYVDGNRSVDVDATTVDEALQTLTETYDGLAKHLRDAEGNLRSFVNVYLNDEDIRFLSDKGATALKSGDTLIIVPSIAGGC